MTKKLIKISVAFVLVLMLVLSSLVPAGAISYTNDVKTKTDSIFLVNMDTDQVVFEKDADTKRYPASLTKIMTYIIVIDNIEDYENTRIEITEEMLKNINESGSSTYTFDNHIGDKMTVLDLLYAMMVPSGNDAAIILADYVSNGDLKKFVQMMNDKANELGCENTNFTNVEGLHDTNHYTTARDLYKITTHALTKPMFEKISNTATHYMEGDDYPLVTTNYMIDQYRGGEYYYTYAKGIKTGTTDEAGHCLVTTASADGYSYMAVMLHSPVKEKDDVHDTMLDAANLFRWALVDLELIEIKTANTPICEMPVRLAWGKDSINLTPQKNLSAIMPGDYNKAFLTIETDLPESIDAPIKEGDVVGTMTVYYKDDKMTEKQYLTTANLVASESVDRSGFLFVIDIIKNIIFSIWFLIALVIIAILFGIYLILTSVYNKKNIKKKKVKKYRNL